MQNTKIRILSTRPIGTRLIDEAAINNIIIDEISFIETKIIGDEINDRINDYIKQTITAIFTSMNAVNAVVKHIKQPVNWKIYCIGITTKNTVADHFGNGCIAGTASNADELADVIIKDKIAHAIFFCGDQRRDEMPEKLKLHDVVIDEVVVYNTIETPVLINKEYDGILFFSPSAVQSFFSVNKISEETKLFAIGSTTAKAIQQYNKNNVVISGLPGKEKMVKRMIEYYNGKAGDVEM